MGAAGLIDIKRRIKSVENTRKITNAMGLVATSKLRRCKKELSINQNFINLLEPIINKLLGSIVEENDSIYFNDNKSKDKLYIVITSETGLCGGFNGNIVSFLNNIVKDDKDHSKVLVIGNRGISYVRRLGIYITEEYIDLSEIPTVKECKIIFEKALKMYLKKEVSEINIVYTKFTSPVKQDAVIEKILPLERVDGEEDSYTVEPNPKVVLEETLNLYLKAKVRSIILNSKCSEQSSRMSAMNAATDNANDLLSSLNLKYNRIRQGMITQEISEIVGGAAAQN